MNDQDAVFHQFGAKHIATDEDFADLLRAEFERGVRAALDLVRREQYSGLHHAIRAPLPTP